MPQTNKYTQQQQLPVTSHQHTNISNIPANTNNKRQFGFRLEIKTVGAASNATKTHVVLLNVAILFDVLFGAFERNKTLQTNNNCSRERGFDFSKTTTSKTIQQNIYK